VSFLLAPGRVQVRMPAQHAVVGEDCSTGCRDPSQNPKVSLAWDMSQIAIARPRCEDSRLDAWAQEIGHKWKIPLPD
jgi:hypothetical protein